MHGRYDVWDTQSLFFHPHQHHHLHHHHVHPCSITCRYRRIFHQRWFPYAAMADSDFKHANPMSDIGNRHDQQLVRKIAFKILPLVLVITCLSVCRYVAQ